ncbi:hypothetical protein ABID22_001251 [Pontibacter aydingkolensis]|uniref:DUF5671 domain-containing protein n=1 Tax=Pontibacter aydingkolensis TaxID=1911536 RepID=A0ABS7CUJ4_9BACT|nr:hypothetical protein [Pontibacter aydingkolensis]MBW7467157.1 hypothetical protein [Pontibacter aydingkolensis]
MLEILKILLLAFFSVAVLLPVVRYMLRTISPARGVAHLTADELKYIQKQDLKLTLVYFFFACALAVFFAGTLALLSSIIHTSKEQLYLLTPNFKAMFAPALLLGLVVALLPLRLIQGTILGHDTELYKAYIHRTEGEKSTQKYRFVFVLLFVLTGVVTWFSLQWHVVIDESGVNISNLLGTQRTYTHQQIQSIHYLGAEGEYLVTFNDQTNINTAYLKPIQLEMMAFLAEQSGHRVIR